MKSLQVQEICRDIKSLDYAKTHLKQTIRSLKRLHMMVEAVEQLKMMISQSRYNDMANLIEAIQKLLLDFQNYHHINRIKSVITEFKSITNELFSAILSNFIALASSPEKFLTKDPATGASVIPVSALSKYEDQCFVIDSLGPETRDLFQKDFLKTRLANYIQTFGQEKGTFYGDLKFTDKRFKWIKSEFLFYDKFFDEIYPKDWEMDIKLAEEWGKITREHLVVILDRTRSETSDFVDLLVSVIKRSIDVENFIIVKFIKKYVLNTTSINPRGKNQENREPEEEEEEEEENAVEEDKGIDMLMLQIEKEEKQEKGLHPNSEEAVKRRLAKFKLLSEMRQKEQQLQQTKAAAEKPRKLSKSEMKKQEIEAKFKGIISHLFESDLLSYVESIKKSLSQKMDIFNNTEDWTLSVTSGPSTANASTTTPTAANPLIYPSVTDLFYYFYGIMKNCHSLTDKQGLYDLAKLYITYLSVYLDKLKSHLPPHSTLTDEVNPPLLTTLQELQLIYALHTCVYVIVQTRTMQEKFVSLINPLYAPGIPLVFAEVYELYENFSGTLLVAISNGLLGRCFKIFTEYYTGKYNEKQVRDKSKYLMELEKEVSSWIWRNREKFVEGGVNESEMEIKWEGVIMTLGGEIAKRWVEIGILGIFGKLNEKNKDKDSFFKTLTGGGSSSTASSNDKKLGENGGEQILMDLEGLKGYLESLADETKAGKEWRRGYGNWVGKKIGKGRVVMKMVMIGGAGEADVRKVGKEMGWTENNEELKKIMELRGQTATGSGSGAKGGAAGDKEEGGLLKGLADLAVPNILIKK